MCFTSASGIDTPRRSAEAVGEGGTSLIQIAREEQCALRLSDIHGNLPALDAVLDDIRQVGVDRIVVGGDVLPEPMPRETMARLLELDIPTQFIYGNGDLAILAQLRAAIQ